MTRMNVWPTSSYFLNLPNFRTSFSRLPNLLSYFHQSLSGKVPKLLESCGIDGGREEENDLIDAADSLCIFHTHTQTKESSPPNPFGSVRFRYPPWGKGNRSSWDIRCRKSNHRECRFASTKYVAAAAAAIWSNKWGASRVGEVRGEERRGGEVVEADLFE